MTILQEESDKCLNRTSSGHNKLLGFDRYSDETLPILNEYTMQHTALSSVRIKLSHYPVDYISTNGYTWPAYNI